MSPPAYHLRPNKAADRFALLDAIRRLPSLGAGALDEYVYYGMGGPYLEEYRLLYEFAPDIRMISFDIKHEVIKRQRFNIPFRTLCLIEEDVSSYIRHSDLGNVKSIFWLDYTSLRYSCFQDFCTLLGTVAENSMIKITLRSDPGDYWNFRPLSLEEKQAEKFRQRFGLLMPDPSADPPRSPSKFAFLVQEMLQIAAERELHRYLLTDYSFLCRPSITLTEHGCLA